MNRAQSTLSLALALVLELGGAAWLGGNGDARAQGVAPPPPPPAYIATVQPEYYEGRPVYFYGGNWYYRDAHGWNYYRREPAYLHERRAHWGEDRRRYHYHR
ncbi:MAG: hypothetical protein ABSC94_10345 [Polyangiaceae bacterium]|jgi:hypothetical protein